MSVTMYKPDGTAYAGDPSMSDAMQGFADEYDGYVLDDQTGETVYDARSTNA